MKGLILAVALPALYWPHGVETAPALERAGIRRLAVPPAQVEAWRRKGLDAVAASESDLASREVLPAPGMAARVELASATRSPWIVANGWRFLRDPGLRCSYELPLGRAAMAAAEAYAYGVDAVLRIEEADLAALGEVLSVARQAPEADLPPRADFALVDDGSALVGEVMNLLVRRNLLFEVADAPSPRFEMNVVIGGAAFPQEAAEDPSAFALKIRRRITDEKRTLRLYGSEAVVGRLTGDLGHVRLHLLNYGGGKIDGLRVRLLGEFPEAVAYVAGRGRVELQDHDVAAGATEFSIPVMGVYAVVDLFAGR
ncbi:MAG TPA: hypothetical protein VIC87_16065 [Vicinamibacteria bacterium]